MAESFLKRLAEDLMHLEVNTIIKSQMSGAKVPDTNREAMYDIAGTYSTELKVIGQKYLPKTHPDFAVGFRGEENWKFGGIMSFEELRVRASDAIKWMDAKVDPAGENGHQLTKDKKMLERIQANSHRLIGVFKKLIKENQAEEAEKTLLTADPSKPHEASMAWNNDIGRVLINSGPDLKLDIKDMMLVRKAWDIGTEEIVMQTIVGIDGDVTTRILERFAQTPNDVVIKLHDDALKTSISFWYKMVDVVVKIGGKAIDKILNNE